MQDIKIPIKMQAFSSTQLRNQKWIYLAWGFRGKSDGNRFRHRASDEPGIVRDLQDEQRKVGQGAVGRFQGGFDSLSLDEPELAFLPQAIHLLLLTAHQRANSRFFHGQPPDRLGYVPDSRDEDSDRAVGERFSGGGLKLKENLITYFN